MEFFVLLGCFVLMVCVISFVIWLGESTDKPVADNTQLTTTEQQQLQVVREQLVDMINHVRNTEHTNEGAEVALTANTSVQDTTVTKKPARRKPKNVQRNTFVDDGTNAHTRKTVKKAAKKTVKKTTKKKRLDEK